MSYLLPRLEEIKERYSPRNINPKYKSIIEENNMEKLLELIGSDRECIYDIIKGIVLYDRHQIFFEIINHVQDINWTFENHILIKYAVNSNAYKIAVFLLENGLDPQVDNNYCIRYISNNNDAIPLLKLFIDYGADIHVDDDYPFRSACYYSANKNIVELVKAGANVNSNDGVSLAYVINGGYSEIIQFLIDTGIDIRARNNIAMHCAIEQYDEETVRLLLNHGSEIPVSDLDIIILEDVIAHGSVNLIKILIENGVDFSIVNKRKEDKTFDEKISVLMQENVNLIAITQIMYDRK